MLQQIQEKAGDKFFKDYGEFAYLKLHFGGIEDLPPNLTENFSQLGKVNSALQQYYEKYQCYPKSEGWQGVKSQWGASKGKIWIDGLVPEFLDSLPQGNGKEFLYCSNGTDYKLLLHQSDKFPFLTARYPDNTDPVRNTYAIGFWTENASQW